MKYTSLPIFFFFFILKYQRESLSPSMYWLWLAKKHNPSVFLICNEEFLLLSFQTKFYFVAILCSTFTFYRFWQGVIAIAMMIPSDFNQLVNYFSFASWLVYGLTAMGVLVLRITQRDAIRPIKVI